MVSRRYHAEPMAASRSPLAVAFGGLVALAVAIGIGRFVYTPILPFMAERLDLTPAESGLVASANLLGHLVGALAAAWIRMPGGRRPWLLGVLALSAVTTAAMGLTAEMSAFLPLRFAGGLASAFAIVLATGLVLDRLAAAGRPALSWMPFAGVGAGIAPLAPCWFPGWPKGVRIGRASGSRAEASPCSDFSRARASFRSLRPRRVRLRRASQGPPAEASPPSSRRMASSDSAT